jgi:outer membrane protein TolC
MKKYVLILCVFTVSLGFSQENIPSVLSLSEYLGYVKSYHPIVKQANLILHKSEALLLKARGAFDPKIEIDFDEKRFQHKDYYTKLNAAFKIPTWYGIELKANFEENEGVYLNRESELPLDGLYSAGVSISLARGFLMNERMASLKKARFFLNQAREEQQILVNEILHNASISYFSWLQSYNEKKIYEAFLNNAEIRLNATQKAFEAGEKPAIDTLEAGITLKTRKLHLEKSRIQFIKSTLSLSSFLWLNNNTPVELQDTMIPDIQTMDFVDTTFNIALFNTADFDIEQHPKIKAILYKRESLDIDRRLKKNNLLPKIDLTYNVLTENNNQLNALNTNDYKAGVSLSLPLFLRKERADLKLAILKLKDIDFENQSTQVVLKNKINAIHQELASFQIQELYTDTIVEDYARLLKAEERKFFLGESSLFLVNSRESKLMDAKLKAINLENAFFTSKAALFKTAAISILE